jgi:NADPH:quinone reductase
MALPVRASVVPDPRWQFVLLYTAPAEAKARAVEDVECRRALRRSRRRRGPPGCRYTLPLEQAAAAHEAVEQDAVGKVLIDVKA